MEMHLDAVLSALLGGGLSTALAKILIGKSLRELEQVSERVGEIKTRLAEISVKLDLAEKDRDLLSKHDRKIAKMENQVYGNALQQRQAPSVS